MNAEEQDKRRGQRIHTALPVILKNVEGVTRDVSASGVFFWTSESSCALGELVSFSVELKRPEGKLKLKCLGDVMRIERRNRDMGVAVKITESALELG